MRAVGSTAALSERDDGPWLAEGHEDSSMDLEDEIKRLRARVAELEIDAQAIFTGAVTHEIHAELNATKKRLAELEKQQRAKG